jgi:hypothetical protein
MPEWAQFREAITAGLPNTGQLLWLRTIEGWLTLAPQAARAALTEARKSSAPQLLYRSMVILNLTIEREAQIHTGPDSGPALQQLFSEVQQGTASNDRSQLAAKLSVLWELAGALLQEDPTLSQGPSDADLAKMNLQQAATDIFKRIDAVGNQTAPGTVTNSSIATVEDVLRDAKALIASTTSDNGALPFVLGTSKPFAFSESLLLVACRREFVTALER